MSNCCEPACDHTAQELPEVTDGVHVAHRLAGPPRSPSGLVVTGIKIICVCVLSVWRAGFSPSEWWFCSVTHKRVCVACGGWKCKAYWDKAGGESQEKEMWPKCAVSLWGRLWSELCVNRAFCRELAALLWKQLRGKLPCMKHGCSSLSSWSEIKSVLNL